MRGRSGALRNLLSLRREVGHNEGPVLPLQGHLAEKKPPLPSGPKHSPTVGFQGGAFF